MNGLSTDEYVMGWTTISSLLNKRGNAEFVKECGCRLHLEGIRPEGFIETTITSCYTHGDYFAMNAMSDFAEVLLPNGALKRQPILESMKNYTKGLKWLMRSNTPQ